MAVLVEDLHPITPEPARPDSSQSSANLQGHTEQFEPQSQGQTSVPAGRSQGWWLGWRPQCHAGTSNTVEGDAEKQPVKYLHANTQQQFWFTTM